MQGCLRAQASRVRACSDVRHSYPAELVNCWGRSSLEQSREFIAGAKRVLINRSKRKKGKHVLNFGTRHRVEIGSKDVTSNVTAGAMDRSCLSSRWKFSAVINRNAPKSCLLSTGVPDRLLSLHRGAPHPRRPSPELFILQVRCVARDFTLRDSPQAAPQGNYSAQLREAAFTDPGHRLAAISLEPRCHELAPTHRAASHTRTRSSSGQESVATPLVSFTDRILAGAAA
jgi:hypothetical protein